MTDLATLLRAAADWIDAHPEVPVTSASTYLEVESAILHTNATNEAEMDAAVELMAAVHVAVGNTLKYARIVTGEVAPGVSLYAYLPRVEVEA